MGILRRWAYFELITGPADEVIAFDDLGAIPKSDVAVQILLSALEHPTSRGRSRVVKYRRQGREERAVFRGGIVCLYNRELHDDELLGAFKSRVHTLNYDPMDAQLGALMLDIADSGWPCGSVNPNSLHFEFIFGSEIRDREPHHCTAALVAPRTPNPRRANDWGPSSRSNDEARGEGQVDSLPLQTSHPGPHTCMRSHHFMEFFNVRK